MRYLDLTCASDLRQTELLGLFKNLHGQFAADGGEAFEEIVEGVAVFQVVEEGLDRDAGAAKDGGAVHDFGVTYDGVLHDSIVAQDGAVRVTPDEERRERGCGRRCMVECRRGECEAGW
jgi:hypothetical protein